MFVILPKRLDSICFYIEIHLMRVIPLRLSVTSFVEGIYSIVVSVILAYHNKFISKQFSTHTLILILIMLGM